MNTLNAFRETRALPFADDVDEQLRVSPGVAVGEGDRGARPLDRHGDPELLAGLVVDERPEGDGRGLFRRCSGGRRRRDDQRVSATIADKSMRWTLRHTGFLLSGGDRVRGGACAGALTATCPVADKSGQASDNRAMAGSAVPLEFRLLGPLEVWRGGAAAQAGR